MVNNTHLHPFNGTFFRTIHVSRYQRGKTNLDFTEARHSEWQWHQLEHASLHLAADRQKNKDKNAILCERQILRI